MSAREALLDGLTRAAERDDRILAVTEGGSAVAGEVDEFSDVDVLIVCTDDGDESLLGEAKEFAEGLGPLLSSFTGEHVGEPRLLICLYGPPLLHVDLKFVSPADLDRRVEDGIVVWERKPGLVAAAATTPARWPSSDAQWIEDRFWTWVHYIAAKIGRGELFECVSGLGYLRDVVFGPMLAARAGRRPQGARRLELYAGDALPLLERTWPTDAGKAASLLCTRRSTCTGGSARRRRSPGSSGGPMRRTRSSTMSPRSSRPSTDTRADFHFRPAYCLKRLRACALPRGTSYTLAHASVSSD
jgi:predicted nucleotidyltransferase